MMVINGPHESKRSNNRFGQKKPLYTACEFAAPANAEGTPGVMIFWDLRLFDAA